MVTKTLKILLVEDDPDDVEIFDTIMEGHEYISATTASDAIKYFKEHQPDIIFMDIGLPDGDGYQVFEQIKKISPHAFVIILTSNWEQASVDTALQKGAAGYIVKPCSTHKINEYIRKFLSQKSN